MVVKEKIGIVVSDKMINTRIVAVNDRITHKRYKKKLLRVRNVMRFTIQSLMQSLAIKYVLYKLFQLVKQKLGQLQVF
jgi:hypothetical protein